MVSNDTALSEDFLLSDINSWIESRLEVQSYIQNLKYALDHGAKVTFQKERIIDNGRDERYTNKFTVADLFPDEDPVEILKRELRNLSVEDYIKTVKDTKFTNRSEMREFGKIYANKDVYIKIRVELLTNNGNHSVFIMSFHYAEKPFSDHMFPYKN